MCRCRGWALTLCCGVWMFLSHKEASTCVRSLNKSITSMSSCESPAFLQEQNKPTSLHFHCCRFRENEDVPNKYWELLFSKVFHTVWSTETTWGTNMKALLQHCCYLFIYLFNLLKLLFVTCRKNKLKQKNWKTNANSSAPTSLRPAGQRMRSKQIMQVLLVLHLSYLQHLNPHFHNTRNIQSFCIWTFSDLISNLLDTSVSKLWLFQSLQL